MKGHPGPDGLPRRKYIYNGVVYITDHSGRHEITSWFEPLVVDAETITSSMQFEHNAAIALLQHPAKWTSHSVLVVDQSGSMRTGDVQGTGDRRSDTVWVTLILDFVADRLEKKKLGSTDVISVIGMGEHATLLVDRAPIDWLLYNDLIRLRKNKPKGDGNYLPAITLADECLRKNTCGRCALLLLFLSDGKPSDQIPAGRESTREKHQKMCAEKVSAVASMYGRRLTFGATGFGPASEDFAVLRGMATAAEEYGCKAIFTLPSLSSESLSASITSLSRSLSTTKTELTDASSNRQKTVKTVRRERLNAPDEEVLSSEWKLYDYPLAGRARSVRSQQLSAGVLDARLEWHERMTEPYMLTTSQWIDVDAHDARARGVALRIPIAGEGVERIVHKFREVDENGAFVGPKLVAKESRYVEDESALRVRFHDTFATTQKRASELSKEFNVMLSDLERGGVIEANVPRIEFLPVCVYLMKDPVSGEEYGYLVEKQLAGKWQKWNSNNGWVAGRDEASGAAAEEEEGEKQTLLAPTGPLVCIDEGDEEEGWSDDEMCDSVTTVPHARVDMSRCTIEVDWVPQAFSHFTWHRSKRKLLVCDLQGVFNAADSPPTYEMTDPVIHHRSQHRREGHKYGATDKGEAGMDKFFSTHVCNVLCHAMKLSTPRKDMRSRNKAVLPMPLGLQSRSPQRGSPRSPDMRRSSPWEDDKM